MNTFDFPSADACSLPLPANDQSTLQITGSHFLVDWLAEQRSSLAFSTYQTGKLFLLGITPQQTLSAFERTFQRCLGLWSDGQTIWMSSQYQLIRFENVLHSGESSGGYDALYVPHFSYITGDLDVHDLCIKADGSVVFVNTLFGCLATISSRYSFDPVWRPPFVSQLAAEDRCHLNGLAIEDGEPAYVTAVSQSDTPQGWRTGRHDGGCVIDVQTDQVIATGLSMPHSPRVYRGRLWLLNSGTGEFGWVDTSTGHFEAIAFCPGYARGLAFIDKFAIIGLSRPREATFNGLAIDSELARRHCQAWCGLIVVDIESGSIVHSLRIEGSVNELYDVIVLPGIVRPKALGFKTDEIRHSVWFVDDGQVKSWIGKER